MCKWFMRTKAKLQKVRDGQISIKSSLLTWKHKSRLRRSLWLGSCWRWFVAVQLNIQRKLLIEQYLCFLVNKKGFSVWILSVMLSDTMSNNHSPSVVKKKKKSSFTDKTLTVWDFQRITLHLCCGYQLKLFTKPIPKPLVSVKHSHIQIHEHTAQVQKLDSSLNSLQMWFLVDHRPKKLLIKPNLQLK